MFSEDKVFHKIPRKALSSFSVTVKNVALKINQLQKQYFDYCNKPQIFVDSLYNYPLLQN